MQHTEEPAKRKAGYILVTQRGPRFLYDTHVGPDKCSTGVSDGAGVKPTLNRAGGSELIEEDREMISRTTIFAPAILGVLLIGATLPAGAEEKPAAKAKPRVDVSKYKIERIVEHLVADAQTVKKRETAKKETVKNEQTVRKEAAKQETAKKFAAKPPEKNAKANAKPADGGKKFIEKPTELLIATKFAPTAALQTKEKAKAKPVDRGKERIERPTELLVENKTAPAGPPRATEKAQAKPADQEKRIIEKPTELLVGKQTAPTAAPRNKDSAAPPREERAGSDQAKNPRVEPGKVRWRGDFAQAKAASEKSGRPVLLFQLLGRLDQEFT